MRTPCLLGAALAVVMASGAFAQTPPGPGDGELLPPPPELAPSETGPGAAPPDANAAAPAGTVDEVMETVPEAGAAEAMQEVDRASRRDERRERRREMRDRRPDRFARGEDDRRGWRRGAGRDGDDERYEWRNHHRGMMGPMMGGMGPGMGMRGVSEGAEFRFSRDGGPTIVIRCAEQDTTQECADAIGPMLQMMLREAQ